MALVWYKQVKPPQRKALFSAWLGYVFDGFDFMMIFYILHIIKADLGITDIQATLIGTVAFIARPIGGGFFGAMADKYGRKPMMMWAIVIYSVGTGLSGVATNLYMLAACRFIVGIGMSGEYACASTYAVESWPKSLQSKASAFLVSGFSIGNIIAAQIIPQFAEAYGWRNSFFIGLLPVLLVLWIRKNAPESQEWIEDKSKEKSTFMDVFRKPHLPISMIVFLVCFSLFGANWPINGLLPTYLSDNGVNTKVISTLMTIAGLGTLTGTIFFGFVGDKIGVKNAFVVGLLTSFVFLCPLFFIPVENSSIIGLCLFGLMFTNLGIAGLIPKFIYDYFPTRLRGLGTGLIYNLGATGGMAAPVLATYISGSFGLGIALFIVTVVFSALLILLVGLDIPGKIYKLSLG